MITEVIRFIVWILVGGGTLTYRNLAVNHLSEGLRSVSTLIFIKYLSWWGDVYVDSAIVTDATMVSKEICSPT